MPQDAASKTNQKVIEIRIRKRPFVVAMWAMPILLMALGLARDFVLQTWGTETFLGRMSPLQLEGESSVTNWYSTILLALISGLLLLMQRAEPIARWRPYWFALALIFIYLSIDEAATLHELTMQRMARFQLGGPLGFSWVVPYGIACIVLAAIFFRFVFAQPSNLKWPIVIGGIVYVGSALGLETVEAHLLTTFGAADARWTATTKLQEIGELVGLSIFAIGLVSSLAHREIAWLLVPVDSQQHAASRNHLLASPIKSGFWQAYLAAAIFTAVFQIWLRLLQCSGPECALSIAKGLIWSCVWPLYWIVFALGIR